MDTLSTEFHVISHSVFFRVHLHISRQGLIANRKTAEYLDLFSHRFTELQGLNSLQGNITLRVYFTY